MLSIYHPPAPAAVRKGHPSDLVQLLATLAARINGALRARSLRATIRELSRLDDRQLDDIGLTRGDIEAVARRSILRA